MSWPLLLALAACGLGDAPGEATPPPVPAEPEPLSEGPWFVQQAMLETTSAGGVSEGGEAIAVFDQDVDGLLDVVIVNGENRIFAFRNTTRKEPATRFVRQATPVGPGDEGLLYKPKGLATHDLDRDGALDLWVATQGEGDEILYKAEERRRNDNGLKRRAHFTTRHNARDGTFPYVDLGFQGAGSQRTVLFDDFDGDGHVDAWRSNSAYWGDHYAGGTEGNALFPGRPGGVFGDDVLLDATVVPEGFWTNEAGETILNFKGAVARDVDGDHRTDILTGTFADVWANWGTDVATGGRGWQGPWVRGIHLFHNQSEPGRLRLVEVAHEAMGPWAWGTDGHTPAHATIPVDLDGDADLDLVIGSYKGENGHDTIARDTAVFRVLRNDSTPGHPRFVDVTEAAGVAWLSHDDTMPEPYPIRVTPYDREVSLFPAMLEGGAFDLDNDGDSDLVMVDRQVLRGDPVTKERYGLHLFVFLNDGQGHLELVDQEVHGLKGTARALSFGDLTGNGRIDLVVSDGSGGGQFVTDNNRVYRNAVDNGFEALIVEATAPGDPWALGTTVTVHAPDGAVLGHDEIRTDFCYRSRREAAVHVGTRDHEKVRVVFGLRDGRTATCDDVVPGRRIRLVVEGDAATLRARRFTSPRDNDREVMACVLSED